MLKEDIFINHSFNSEYFLKLRKKKEAAFEHEDIKVAEQSSSAEKLLYKVLKQITGRVLLEFKVLIWEPRNELQIKEEKQCGISSKDKKAKSHSNRTEVGVKNVGCKMLESNWNKWNDSAFHRGGH
ncbi:hypothetical protein GLOIN_2v1844848 [Rhizophagus irregularis DAOM 181602=DAOM 197198]|uniref:Uncharacterized protein n=1 Tax=Rhizophagus irregularis (strain DAOM 181602 / DAOM 197198 / MUCL 43194) TaxID=747089 RepID=A0A2P4PIS0_RHIID|nr:hypothetical protein GLOIN_2v1844848 [Rhizophagus irregularis DAOM 181602=DAOM 197198]POG65291.1 hypothetical protein GLOIN_2v1844848 [Rhizophagus irregularis DAOM 181602=DAOM 197198]|eukprot:XP_025172157.1 hypothetical protein GLOIN_2v1844848 [Rhizophagus irregularis DAOM 181602=DAOM 197198]